MNYQQIGKRIKKKRLEAKYTQSELAELVRVKKSFISEVERGNRSLSVESLIHMAQALRVTTDYILLGK